MPSVPPGNPRREAGQQRSQVRSMAKQRVHVWISGTVQGVGFRFVTERQALHLDLSGWGRNLRDGRVEPGAEGGERAVVGPRRGPVEMMPPGAPTSRLINST